ncbi:efflux RND transporter permease subunit [Cohnella panacarvi]|uniref:efflux RND transporter permease subunit n=1 Tax=Cohnella panacarvi TaxID=400776 RepID=UPI00047CD7A9|nr:efflux RND transporter permease subunit [Cohnella panacarvi]
MKYWVRFSMNNGIALLLIVAIMIGSGLYAMSSMKKEKYPAVDIPYLTVEIAYPGASPTQVMDTFGKDLEAELNRLDRLENLYVTAGTNYFLATMNFEMGYEMDEAEVNARSAVGKVSLPASAKVIDYYKDRLDGDVYAVGVWGSEQSAVQAFVKDQLLPAYRGVDGIDRIDTDGVVDDTAIISLRDADMLRHGLDADQVKLAVTSAQLSVPIGNWDTDRERLPIRVGGTVDSLAELKSLLIPTAQGGIPLSAIADIEYEQDEDEQVRMNGQPAVFISVVGRGGYDSVKLVDELIDAENELALPAGISKKITTDRTEEIEQSVDSMLREVLLGACMAMLVTLLFLRNFRSTLIAIISIPLSMIASMLVLKQLDYSLNIMTLAGIAVAIGRVVDDSIVVIENIFRRVRKTTQRDDQLVEDATNEVSRAITSSTLTTVAVFLPMAFVPGIVGAFFRPLAWTIVVSLLFSLLVAVTVVPLLSKLSLLKVRHKEQQENALQRAYRRMLSWSLTHRLLTLLLAFVLLIGSMAILVTGQLGFNFLPAEPTRDFSIDVTMEEGVNLQATNKVVADIEERIRQHPVHDMATEARSQNANLSFELDESAGDSEAFERTIREELKHIQGAKTITLTGQQGIGSNELMITVNGPDSESIRLGAQMMVEAIQDVEGLEDVHHTGSSEKPEVQFVADDRKLANAGLNNALVAQAVNRAIGGETLGTALLDGRSADIKLRTGASPEQPAPIESLNDIKVTNLAQQPVRLGDVGSWERKLNPSSIMRLNQKEYLQINGTFTDSNTGGVIATVESKLDALNLPDGVTWESLGASKEMNDGFVNMGLALGISIFLVYLVMLLSFGEWLTPFVILFSIPFSLIGALAGLWIVGEPVGMPAMIGLLMLNGIVVTNAIVLLERVRSNLKQGMDRDAALLEAGATRIRPILMTAIATIGALFPLALSSEVGLVSRALAVVVIGGLSTSTLLTLIIVPVLFSLTHRKRRLSKPRSAAAKSETAAELAE